MQEMWDWFAKHLLPHWPFIATTAILATIGQAAKKVVTKELAAKKRWAWVFRQTMKVHPVLAGAAVGFIPGMPVSPGVAGTPTTVLYFALAGVASSYFFDFVRDMAEKKGIKLPPPSSSINPEPPQ